MPLKNKLTLKYASGYFLYFFNSECAVTGHKVAHAKQRLSVTLNAVLDLEKKVERSKKKFFCIIE